MANYTEAQRLAMEAEAAALRLAIEEEREAREADRQYREQFTPNAPPHVVVEDEPEYDLTDDGRVLASQVDTLAPPVVVKVPEYVDIETGPTGLPATTDERFSRFLDAMKEAQASNE